MLYNFTAEDAKAYREKHECGLLEAKRALMLEARDQFLQKLYNRIHYTNPQEILEELIKVMREDQNYVSYK